GGGGSPPPTSYTVTFSANGGTGSMPAETESSSTALTSNGFANAGYSFSGWNTLANGTGMTYANDATYSFSSSITLYAQWTALPSFTVTFNSNGGTGSMSAETENVATALTSNAFARTGYTFAGWSTTANGSLAYANDATYPFTASVTLYALWAQDFTVTFNANGGAGSMSAETDSSPTALESNTFAYAGHTFTDWNTAANGSGTPYANDATYPFAASVILYAQWATDYTVTFNANGGTGSMSAETDSSPTPLTSNAFANAGDAFNGWNTAADGSGTAYANDATYAFAASVTLYAQWTVNSAPSITLQPASQVLESGRTATFTASATGTPTPSVQWNVSINDGSSWSVITGATSATYSVTITPFDNGYEYEAIFTNVNGSATTTAAQLTVATTSSNWSGYVDTGGTFSAVSAKWIVPTVTCTTGSLTAVQWVGIDGYGSSTVEQDGTETSCNGTTASYYAWYEMYGDASVNNGYLSPLSTSTYPVTPGNVMSASVSYAAGEWTLSVANTTVGWTFSIDIASPTPPPAQVSAEWIAEDPDECSGSCTMATLADFGSVTFTNASVTSNGVTGSITSSTVAAIDEIDSSNIVMSAPGPLSGGGTSFTDTWESST
ncbi:MAG: G1 family glutamic endopeptidase, partial [Acidimicrobiales bacterium]